MADSESLKANARKRIASVRSGVQKLFSGGLAAPGRVATRNALIEEFDELKKIFKQMNKLEEEKK